MTITSSGLHKPHVPWIFPKEFLDFYPEEIEDIPLANDTCRDRLFLVQPLSALVLHRLPPLHRPPTVRMSTCSHVRSNVTPRAALTHPRRPGGHAAGGLALPRRRTRPQHRGQRYSQHDPVPDFSEGLLRCRQLHRLQHRKDARVLEGPWVRGQHCGHRVWRPRIFDSGLMLTTSLVFSAPCRLTTPPRTPRAFLAPTFIARGVVRGAGCGVLAPRLRRTHVDVSRAGSWASMTRGRR